MDYENITAGIEPGGSKKIYEARILICFLLNLLNKPLSRSDINNILQYKSLVNYFTFAQAFNDIIKDKHIVEYKGEDSKEKNIEPLFVLTAAGKKTADVFKNTIASTVKNKLELAAKEYLNNLKLLEENIVTINKVDDGYMVLCRIKDVGSDLITINIFAPDKQIAERIKKNFVKGSLELYQYIFDFLTY